MISKFHTPFWLISFGILATSLPAADNFIRDGSFELGKGWSLFIPPESKDHAVKFEYVSGGLDGTRAGRLLAEEVTRAGLSNTRFSVIPGERYKLTFNYKAEPNGVVASGLPGLVIRVNVLDVNKNTMPPIFVLSDGKVGPTIKALTGVPKFATQWTKVDAIIDAPQGASTFDINVFLWGYQGAMLFDDISMQLAP